MTSAWRDIVGTGRRPAPWVAALLLAAIVAPRAAAQGTLTGQGFGYPLGGLSARSLANGAGGEFDGQSARNPAAVVTGLRAGLFLQYDPEFREVTAGASTDNNVVPRFAALGVLFRAGEKGAVSISTHSLLDRTWSTRVRSGQRLGPDSVLFTETNRSSGAINETRLSYGYAPFQGKLAIGAAFHLITGENRLTLRREFDDSLRYGTLSRGLTIAYSGTGFSTGAIYRPVTWFSVAASARRGAGLELRVEDTLKTSASVPNRLGVAARFDAIPGVSLMASADRNTWSRLNGLGSVAADARDAWEYGVGADFSAARSTRLVNWVYSVGYRTRELPFAAAGAPVDERLLSGGVSAPLAGGRATVDITGIRATRQAAGAVGERAWQVSVGLTVRP